MPSFNRLGWIVTSQQSRKHFGKIEYSAPLAELWPYRVTLPNKVTMQFFLWSTEETLRNRRAKFEAFRSSGWVAIKGARRSTLLLCCLFKRQAKNTCCLTEPPGCCARVM